MLLETIDTGLTGIASIYMKITTGTVLIGFLMVML